MKFSDLTAAPLLVAAPATTGIKPLSPEDRKLQSGAHEFEAMLLGEMLKPLHFGGAPGEDAETTESGANGTLAGFGTEAVAKALAAHGGFGIATRIIGQVSAQRDRAAQVGPGTKV